MGTVLKRISIAAVSVAVLAVFVFVSRWISGPSEGSIKAFPTEAELVDGHGKAGDIRHTGKFLSFRYPVGFEQKSAPNDLVSLEKGAWYRSDAHPAVLSYSVRNLEGSSLESIPDYLLRAETKKGEYVESSMRTPIGVANVFTRSMEGYERTGFVVRGTRVFIISVTATSFADPNTIDSDFETVLQSLAVTD